MSSKRQRDEESPPRKKQHTSPAETAAPSSTLPISSSLSPQVPFLPSFGVFTTLRSSDITSSLPPLPKPANPELEKQAFIHLGSTSGADLTSYEELEWFGDSVIEFLSTCLIHATFKTYKVGRRSQLREMLVRNKTLGKFFHAYRMQERMVVPQEFWQSNKSTIDKVYGDMFEAYVGAVVLSHQDQIDVGMRIAMDWLRVLWGNELRKELQVYEHEAKYYQNRVASTSVTSEATAEASSNTPGNAGGSKGTLKEELPKGTPKDQLGKLLAGPGVKITYEDMPVTEKKRRQQKAQLGQELFHVGVYLDGWGAKHELLGIGGARKKSEAGNKAAMQAMEAKKIIRKYSEKKQAFLRAREAAGGQSAREREEEREKEKMTEEEKT